MSKTAKWRTWAHSNTYENATFHVLGSDHWPYCRLNPVFPQPASQWMDVDSRFKCLVGRYDRTANGERCLILVVVSTPETPMIILRRFAAAALDLAIVLSYILAIGYTALDLHIFSPDDTLGRFTNFGFPFIYYAILDSRLGGGGTIGKRLFGLQVYERTAQTIPIHLALARTVIKLAIPLLTLKMSANLATMHPFPGVAMGLGGLLILPISILISRGAIGLHDSLPQTWVGTSAMKKRPLLPRWHWISAFLMTAVIASSATLLIKVTIWPSSARLNIESVAQMADPNLAMAKELVLGDGSEPIRHYVQHADVSQSVDPFPESFTDSFAKAPPTVVQQLHGQFPEMMITFHLAQDRFRSYPLRAALIQRAWFVLAPQLSSSDRPKFVWISFDTEKWFGPMEVRESDRYILVGRRGERIGTAETGLFEPDHNIFMWFGFQLSGFWQHPSSLGI